MFWRLIRTTNDPTLTVLRLVVGIVFFATVLRRRWVGSEARASLQLWPVFTNPVFQPYSRFLRFARNFWEG